MLKRRYRVPIARRVDGRVAEGFEAPHSEQLGSVLLSSNCLARKVAGAPQSRLAWFSGLVAESLPHQLGARNVVSTQAPLGELLTASAASPTALR